MEITNLENNEPTTKKISKKIIKKHNITPNNEHSYAPTFAPLNNHQTQHHVSEYLSFMNKYIVKKDETKQITNTRIPEPKLNIYGASYSIPDEEYSTFMKLYYNECIKGGRKEYLTECQLKTNSPIIIDIDFRYDYSVTKRKHTDNHILDLVELYLNELKTMFQMDNTTKIPFFIFEKDSVNRLEEKQITKDGIHIIIGLQCNHNVQVLLRQRIIEKISTIWDDLPIKNTWDEVFDIGLSKGHTNLQLYGSMKPNHEPYRLKYVYLFSFENGNGSEKIEKEIASKYENIDNIEQLSIRYKKHCFLFMTDALIEELNKQETKHANPHIENTTHGVFTGIIGKNEEEIKGLSTHEILQIRSKEQLDNCIQQFLNSLELVEYNLRDAYEYTMILPEKYYNDGTFTNWIRVGWALRNISNKLFVVWLAFSAKSSLFNYHTDVDDLYDRWEKFEKKDREGLTIRSIMYWARNENYTEFKKVTLNSIDAYINKTLDRAISYVTEEDNKIRGFTDFDIACVLYRLYKDEYVCVSVKNNIWYRFTNHCWTEINSGTTLRRAISETLRDLYFKKQGEIGLQMIKLEVEDPLKKKLKKKLDILLSIVERLGKTSDKNNIMTEAKELFYDNQFIKKIDTDPYILCFKNGVIDFREKRFRNGNPEDYISKCTNINYYELKDSDQPVINEINDFMHKLFPNEQLYKYMWEHLASTLIGTTTNQTFNMYIGEGQNGKSVLVNLMEQVLGDYKGDVPLTLITQTRTKIGGVSPEIVQLKGTRYAVMQEPSRGDKINEGIMKQISAGDALTGRAPFMVESLTFTPQFKLVVCSNEFMEIKTQDHGTWRRIRVVDFETLFTENPKKDDPDKPYQYKLDKNIKDKFIIWREVFASMLVKIAYKTNGIVEDCDKVLSSSNTYRKEQDVISEYLQDRIIVANGGCITRGQLSNDFMEWYSLNFGSKRTNTKDLITGMDKKFGKSISGVWNNVRFRPILTRIEKTDDEYDDESVEKDEEDEINLQEL